MKPSRWHYPRLLAIGWLFHMKHLSRSPFQIVSLLVFPLMLASAVFFLFRASSQPGALVYAAIGSGLVSIWDSTLFGSGGAIQEQRWFGTLEVMVAAPSPLISIIAPLTLATSSLGIYSFASTLMWGWLVFGVDLSIADPFAFIVAVPVTIVALGMLGIVLASTFVYLRNANALCNMLTYPMAIAAGLLVPLDILPGWVAPISWVLAPSWGARAIREAVAGGKPWVPLVACAGIGVAYALLGALLLRRMERLARQHASLDLA